MEFSLDLIPHNRSIYLHKFNGNTLFLDNGKAVGGLLPRKGKPPVVKPGEEVSFSYPLKGMAEKAGNVTLLVKTVSQ